MINYSLLLAVRIINLYKVPTQTLRYVYCRVVEHVACFVLKTCVKENI